MIKHPGVRMGLLPLLVGGFLLLGSTAAPAADEPSDVSHGALLAITCFACHGFEGKSVGGMPSIRGFPADYLISQMQAFRDGSRPSTVMGRHATGYSDEELRAMAHYIEMISKQ